MKHAAQAEDVNHIQRNQRCPNGSARHCAHSKAFSALLNLTKTAHDLLQITKLYTVFDVKDDEAATVKSFSK